MCSWLERMEADPSGSNMNNDQESLKFMRHSRRTRLKVDDIDYALKVRNIEVHLCSIIYGSFH